MKSFVKQSKKKYIKLDYIAPIMLLIIILIIATNPTKYSLVAFKGLEVWAKILVPSLFPFFVLTKLFSSSSLLFNLTSILNKPLKKMYNCPPISGYVFFMSIITGYPVGAKLVCDLYYMGNLTQKQAIKTMSFCANSGPMFILGSVALGMFGSFKMGIIILISHILGSILNGLVYRNIKETKQNNKTSFAPNKINFSESINASISSILLIGGVICFTFVVLEVIVSSKLFIGLTLLLQKIGINQSLFAAIFSGIGEITKGCLMLKETGISASLATFICTLLISFGGISTILQSLTFIKDIVPTKIFIFQKITHALLASLVCILLLLIF